MDKPICPMLSTDNNGGMRCLGDNCAWYVEFDESCAIYSLVLGLDKISEKCSCTKDKKTTKNAPTH